MFALAGRLSAESILSQLTPLRRVLMVAKTTRYEFERERRGLQGAELRHSLERDGLNWATMRAAHDAHWKNADGLWEALDSRGVRCTVIKAEHFKEDYMHGQRRPQLVISVGGDGTLLRAASYIMPPKPRAHQEVPFPLVAPLLGVNTDSRRSAGALCSTSAARAEDHERIAAALLDGTFHLQPRRRITVELVGPNGDSRLLPRMALNEVFSAERNAGHTCVHQMRVDDGPEESHRSSGVVVATGTGCSGWISNAFALYPETVQRVLEAAAAPHDPALVHATTQKVNQQCLFSPSSPRVQYIVREGMPHRPGETCTRYWGFANQVELMSKGFDMTLTLDGQHTFDLPWGHRARLRTREEDSLWMVQLPEDPKAKVPRRVPRTRPDSEEAVGGGSARQPPPAAPPGLRRWSDGALWAPDAASQAPLAHTHADQRGVRVMSYNILAESLARRHRDALYKTVQSDDLAWPQRLLQIVQEVGSLRPAVVALQEVERHGEVAAALAALGYAGIAAARHGPASQHGCSTFWHEERFELHEQHTVQFSEFGLAHNVALLAALLPRDAPGPALVVANTHLLFDPERGDIKMGQARLLLERAHAFAARVHAAVHAPAGPLAPPAEPGPVTPILVCGDFNSTPDSCVYRLVRHGAVDVRAHNRKMMSGQQAGVIAAGAPGPGESDGEQEARYGAEERCRSEGEELLLGQHIVRGAPLWGEPDAREDRPGPPMLDHAKALAELNWSSENLALACDVGSAGRRGEYVVRQPVDMRSAYRQVADAEPEYTSYNSKFLGTCDYIWYATYPQRGAAGGGSDEWFRPKRVLHPPPVAALVNRLPARVYGSDHISLVCDFELV